MSKKPFYFSIFIPIIIYLLFAIPSLKEWASADSVPFLIAADTISGSHPWFNFSYINLNGLWHPPLYVIILSILRKLFGMNIVFFRLFNLICCTISIFFIYFITRELNSDKKDYSIPLIASFIYAINPFVVRGSLHIDIDNTILTTLILAFIFLFLKNMDYLNKNSLMQLSFVFALLLSAKLTTPLILAFVILFYLLINKKIIESVVMTIVFVLGFIFFYLFWILYCLKFNYPLFIIFKNAIVYVSCFKLAINAEFLYGIFRAILWFSPFFLLLWLLKIINRLNERFRCKILNKNEDLLIIISIIFFMFYLYVGPINHTFPKYLFPVISIMSILIADIIAKVKGDILYSIKTFIFIICLVVIFNIIFVGDLLYLTNYTIKERFIRSGLDVLVLYNELFNVLSKLLFLSGISLLIFIFYHKKRRLSFISAAIITLFIMFLSGSLALNIIQSKAKYQVIYTYGKEGTKELVSFLKTQITSDDRITAPYEILYYSDAVKSGFVFVQDFLSPEDFIRALKDINPAVVVYGIASNTIKQYRETFNSDLVYEYFRDHYFISKDIGSYTVWVKNNKNFNN